MNATSVARDGEPLPLANVRVVDLSMVWSGPACTRVLADMGAEVLKIEACQRLDHIRYQILADNEPGDRPWERGWWHGLNRNKLDVTLNLSDQRAITLLKSLVQVSDVFVENFSPRVMRNLGLSYDGLRRIRPDLIMVSLSGFGQTGPYLNYGAYGHILEHLSGLSSVTGYPGGDPTVVDSNIADPTSGIWAAGEILAALIARARDGNGHYVDFSELEAVENLLGAQALEYTVNGRVRGLEGNSHPGKAPHGVFRCANDDRWVAIAVGTNEEWSALCKLIGQAAWINDRRLLTGDDRKRHEDEIDAAVNAWTCRFDHREAMRLLQEAGVPAGAVLSPKEQLTDPHHLARGFFQKVNLPEAGPRLLPGPLFQISGVSPKIRTPGPALGEHNGYALNELLAIDQAQCEELRIGHVIGTIPFPYIPPVGVPIPALIETGLVEEVDPKYRELLGLEPGHA